MVPLNSGLSLLSACSSIVASSPRQDSSSFPIVPRDDSDADLDDHFSSTSTKRPHPHRTTSRPSQTTFLKPSAAETSTASVALATAVDASAGSSTRTSSLRQEPHVGLLIGSLAGILFSVIGIVMLLLLLRKRRRQVTFIVVNPPNLRDPETISQVDSLKPFTPPPASASAKKPVQGLVKRPRLQIPPPAKTSLRKSEIGQVDANPFDESPLDEPPKSSSRNSLSSATSETSLLPGSYTNTSRVARYTIRYW